jgi:carboxypeptidase Taq
MTDGIRELRERMATLSDLRNVNQLVEWDQQTMMPPKGVATRAEALATLGRLRHEIFVSDETGRLLDTAAAELNGGHGRDSDDAALVRVTSRRWSKARRVPSDLAADLARAGSVGQEAWVAARANSDFASFAPYLERNLELARRYVECFDEFDCAYDALLDNFEPGMTTGEVSTLFAQLKSELVPMIATLAQHRDRVDDSCLHGSFPIDGQRQLAAEVVQWMGFDRASWRMDDAVHPFATGLGSQDVRITTRWDESYFPSSLYGAMHECGHGLYEAGIAASLQRTPLGYGESLALHESQSRMWENMVGRSRVFCGVLAPTIVEVLGDSVGALEDDGLYRAVNRIAPSFIRVEADEVTYGLHIVLRFELEQELIEGRIKVAELPEVWNARYKEYFGLEVPDDAQGVLQDVHWSVGLIGYFPTYALGNLIAGQLWQQAHLDVPDLDRQLAAGELSGLREWLRENVHRHGSKYSSRELLERVVGGPIAVGPFLEYLKDKLGDVYGLEL